MNSTFTHPNTATRTLSSSLQLSIDPHACISPASILPSPAVTLSSPQLTDIASASSTSPDSLASSPLSFMDSRSYSMTAGPDDTRMNDIKPLTTMANPSDIFMYPMPSHDDGSLNSSMSELSNSIISSHMQMPDFMPIDYTLQQQRSQPHQHHHSMSAINTSQSPSNLLSGGGPTLTSSSLDMIPPIMSYISLDHTQQHSGTSQMDYLHNTDTMDSVNSNTPRYMFSLDDTNNDPQGADLEASDDHGRRIRSISEGELNLGAIGSLNSSQLPLPIKVEKQDDKDMEQQERNSTTTTTSTTAAAAGRRQATTRSGRQTSTTSTRNGDAGVKLEDDAAGEDESLLKRKRMVRRRLTKNQKIAHNKIEKKYRTNINEKIFGLQDLICGSWNGDEEASSSEDEDEDAARGAAAAATSTTKRNAPAPKRRSSSLDSSTCSPDADEDTANPKYEDASSSNASSSARPNKSSILERAASYIKYLKASNEKLKQRNASLKLGIKDGQVKGQ